MNFKQWFLKEVNIDNENGWGQTPKNSSIDYFGIRVKMKPSVFLKLAASGGGDSVEAISQHIKSGGSIGAPFLSIQFPQSWRDNIIEDYPEVTGHEGRNRMLAVLKTEGDIPIEVHLFGGRKSIEVRKIHIKSSWIQQMKKGMYSETQTRERGKFIPGPLFDEIHGTDFKHPMEESKSWLLKESPDKLTINNETIRWTSGETFILFTNYALYTKNSPMSDTHNDIIDKLKKIYKSTIFPAYSSLNPNLNQLDDFIKSECDLLSHGLMNHDALEEIVEMVQSDHRNSYAEIAIEPEIILGRIWPKLKVISFWNRSQYVFAKSKETLDFIRIFGDPVEYQYDIQDGYNYSIINYEKFIKKDLNETYETDVKHPMEESKSWLLKESPDKLTINNKTISWTSGVTFFLFNNYALYTKGINYTYTHNTILTNLYDIRMNLYPASRISIDKLDKIIKSEKNLLSHGEINQAALEEIMHALHMFKNDGGWGDYRNNYNEIKGAPNTLLGRIWPELKVISFWNRAFYVFAKSNEIIDFIKIFGDPTEYQYNIQKPDGFPLTDYSTITHQDFLKGYNKFF